MPVSKIDGARQFYASDDVDFNSFKLTSVAVPTADDDGANKYYVDTSLYRLDLKASCRAATTATLTATYADGSPSGVGATLTATSNGAIAAQDGITLVLNDRLLVKDQTNARQNGIYTVTQVGSGGSPFILTRGVDSDMEIEEVNAGLFTFVEEGTLYEDTGWVLITDNPIDIDGTSGSLLNFVQFSGSGTITAGDGLIQTGNAFDINLDTGVGGTSGLEIVADQLVINLSATPHLQIVDNELSVTTDVVTNSRYNASVLANETPNGSLTNFTFTPTLVAGTEMVFLNGQLLTPVTDYTLSGSTVVFGSAPTATDTILATYLS